MDLGAPELVIILILVLLLFGSAKLPKLARSIGEAQREFKKGHQEHDSEPAPPTPPAVPPASAAVPPASPAVPPGSPAAPPASPPL